MIFIGTKYSLDLLSGFKISSSWFKILSLPFFEYDGYIGGTTAGYHPAECVGIFIMGGYFSHSVDIDKNNYVISR